MPTFAANLTFLFKEYPFLERFAEARAAGFKWVEVLFPYEDSASEIERRMIQAGVQMALINCPPPNYAGGNRGFAAIPSEEDRFRKDFTRALRYAERLDARHLHIMAGKAKGHVARETYKRNLAWAVKQAPRQSLTIEPINEIDMPGYFLNSFDLAADILDEIGAPNLGLQFDAYHAQIITGDALKTWEDHGHRARHIQIASSPDRSEPRKGEIDYPAFFARLDAQGYTGLVSAEYTPTKRTEEGLGWLSKAQK